MNFEELKALVADICYKDWRFVVGAFENDVAWLRVEFDCLDANTGSPGTEKGRKWLISTHMVRSEIVLTALMAVLAAEEHEAREHFRYRGRAIVNPHIDVEVMMRYCGKVDVRE